MSAHSTIDKTQLWCTREATILVSFASHLKNGITSFELFAHVAKEKPEGILKCTRIASGRSFFEQLRYLQFLAAATLDFGR